MNSVHSAVSRDELYALVWSEPMTKVAARFDVSASYLARVCTLLNVPRPERGYWAKLAVDKAPPRPLLPEPQPGDPIEWSRGDGDEAIARPLPLPPKALPTRPRRALAKRPAQHALLRGAKAHFEDGRLSHELEYLKPAKRLLVDLATSRTGLERALDFANQLFLSLEARGHRVVIAAAGEKFHRAELDEREVPARNKNARTELWSPFRPTVVYVGTVAIGLTVIELSEEVEMRYVDGKYVRESEFVASKRTRHREPYTWTTKRNLATGRLCLQAYSPYWRAQWQRQWREAKGTDLLKQVPGIVRALEQEAIEIARLVEEGQRQAEVERKRWDVEMAEQRRVEAEWHRAKSIADSKAELLKIIDDWSKAMSLNAFFDDAQRRLKDVAPQDRERLEPRLRRARELVGSVDPLERFTRWLPPEERDDSRKYWQIPDA